MKNAIFEEIQINVQGLTKEEARDWLETASCESGCVSGMIYHSDTLAFFDKFESEIIELAEEYDFKPDAVELGMTAFKNNLAWFTFEMSKDEVFESRLSDFDFKEEEEEEE
jgi:hypothetical protein